jgi:tetratricopeptide (TPR) repeat protein
MMTLADPYSPCPCGSGKKHKWCCQKAASAAERVQRLRESGQSHAALGAVHEALAKNPANPWLLRQQAHLLIEMRQLEQAEACLEEILRQHPQHLGAATDLIRLATAIQGPVAAASRLQRFLARIAPDQRGELAELVLFLSSQLSAAELLPAAIKHHELAMQLAGGNLERSELLWSGLTASEGSPWLKHPYSLEEAPQTLSEDRRREFEEALDWARAGLWELAAAGFERLTADPAASGSADRNLGLCRLWLGDHARAVAALRRWIAGAGSTTEAVDLELLCQILDESSVGEPVEHLRLTWPLRNRVALIEAIERHDHCAADQAPKGDRNQPEDGDTRHFFLLDRPRAEARMGLRLEEIPVVLGRIEVASDQVHLETFDDGRLHFIMDRFTAIAGTSVPPAHPKTKVLGRVGRSEHALMWFGMIPPDLPGEEHERILQDQRLQMFRQVWPETPMPYLGGRTPREASRAGDASIALRAALLAFEYSEEPWTSRVDWNEVRSSLGIEPEPLPDAATIPIERIHLGRLAAVDCSRLSDEGLIQLWKRAEHWGIRSPQLRAAAEIAARPGLAARFAIPATTIYGLLAHQATQSRQREEALHWIRRGRQEEDPSQKTSSAPVWDLLGLQIQMRLDNPEAWVPELAQILERYRGNDSAISLIVSVLVRMDLVRIIEDPKDPENLQVDSRPLEALFARYGPRITHEAVSTGGSASPNEIWTPGSAFRSTTIWTPGSDPHSPPTATEKPRIIVPGR